MSISLHRNRGSGCGVVEIDHIKGREVAKILKLSLNPSRIIQSLKNPYTPIFLTITHYFKLFQALSTNNYSLFEVISCSINEITLIDANNKCINKKYTFFRLHTNQI